MARVELEQPIRAPVDVVYAVARDVEAFPQFMPDVKSVRVLERSEDGARTLTEWVAYASQLKLQVKWVEEDLWNDQEHTCHFRQAKGDYDQMEGWSRIQRERFFGACWTTSCVCLCWALLCRRWFTIWFSRI